MNKTKMLKKNYEFSNVFSKGKYYSGKTIGAYILNNGKNQNYLGLAISVKSGHAYQRNKVKRLIRENYRNMEENLKEGVTIIFLWKKSCDIREADYYQVQTDIERIFQSAKILVDDR